MKRKIYRCLQFLLSFFIAFTMPVFSMFEVHADGLDVNQAINDIIGGNIGNTFYEYGTDCIWNCGCECIRTG